MKTRVATSPIWVLALLLGLSACGNDSSHPHFDDKNYGIDTSAVKQPEPTSDDANPVIFVPTPTVKPKATPTPTPTPTPSPSPTEPDVTVGDDGGGDGDEEGTLPPDALIVNLQLNSYFDTNSAIGIREGRGYKSLGLAASQIKAKLTSSPGDGMALKETYGDGVSRSLATQDITNSAGDANRNDGAPSASVLQSLHRVTSPDCPSVILCIEKLVYEPHDGAATTLCFKDAATGKPAVFPYGALPNYKAADFASAYGDYGPYIANSYAGIDVDCSAPGAAPVATETVGVTISSVSLSAVPFKLHKTDPIAPSFAVRFDRHRVSHDDTAPYIDETINLPKGLTYVISESEAEILHLVVTKRQEVDISSQSGGGLFGGLIGLLVGIDGLQVDLHFEMCQNLLKPDEPDHCQ